MVWDSLTSIEKSDLKNQEKLRLLYNLKNISEKCKLPLDSVYAKVVYTAGLCELNNKNYETAIELTTEALRLNLSGREGSSKISAISNYYALGYYYSKLTNFNKALLYFDSTIILAQSLTPSPNIYYHFISARLEKVNAYRELGDYEKVVEESTFGIKNSINNIDTDSHMFFLDLRSLAYYYQDQINESIKDVNSIIELSRHFPNTSYLSDAYKIKALDYGKKRQFSFANSFFLSAIKISLKAKDFGQISGVYNDFGILLLDSLKNYAEAQKYFLKAIEYAEKAKDSLRLSEVSVNAGEAEFKQHKYEKASKNFSQALLYLNVNCNANALSSVTAKQLNAVGFKDAILSIIIDKTKLLLAVYKRTKKLDYLRACLQSALTTDTVITQIRYTQLGEQSKLYWRNKTRDFFNDAIEACFAMNDTKNAFYFMEKSKAVLLNDKLNELNASNRLSKADASKQEIYQIRIVELQQQLSTLTDTSIKYQQVESQLINARGDFEHFIATLDQKYPSYYQYKYDDYTPSLKDFQNYLSLNKQSFVDYFFNGNVCYILDITQNRITFIKRSANDITANDIATFLQLCSDKEQYFRNRPLFNSLSNKLYKALFKLLDIPKGRTIICPDNFVIPFEALCTDNAGKNFLINNYAFSYTYSARFLMKHYDQGKASGNFVGFAPASFSVISGVTELQKSVSSIQKCASFYKTTTLFINNKASKYNFLSHISDYTVANIFSHAMADTSDDEPRLFMHDSIIALTELQSLPVQNSATQLVILSACETDVGKNATGEGIYSLARGFSAAGIPSVAATLWNADEESIYSITEKFNEYIASGISKDIALQKAKLEFISSDGDAESKLPYYWANMILIGNAKPIVLSNSVASINFWIWVSVIGVIVLSSVTFLFINVKCKQKR